MNRYPKNYRCKICGRILDNTEQDVIDKYGIEILDKFHIITVCPECEDKIGSEEFKSSCNKLMFLTCDYVNSHTGKTE